MQKASRIPYGDPYALIGPEGAFEHGDIDLKGFSLTIANMITAQTTRAAANAIARIKWLCAGDSNAALGNPQEGLRGLMLIYHAVAPFLSVSSQTDLFLRTLRASTMALTFPAHNTKIYRTALTAHKVLSYVQHCRAFLLFWFSRR